MLDLDVKIDTREIEAALSRWPKQIPYAIKAGIDSCLFVARKRISSDLPRYFHIRTPFVQRGLNVTQATKTNLTGTVGFLDSRWFMPSQITGESGRKKPGDKPIWMPLARGPRSPRPDIRKAIIPSRRPNVAGAKTLGGASIGRELKVKRVNEPGYFKVLSGKIYPGIYYRPSDLSRKIVPAYWLQPHMDIKPRYPMLARVESVVKLEWPRASIAALQRTLFTMRR